MIIDEAVDLQRPSEGQNRDYRRGCKLASNLAGPRPVNPPGGREAPDPPVTREGAQRPIRCYKWPRAVGRQPKPFFKEANVKCGEFLLRAYRLMKKPLTYTRGSKSSSFVVICCHLPSFAVIRRNVS
jgi:hypothetical protein